MTNSEEQRRLAIVAELAAARAQAAAILEEAKAEVARLEAALENGDYEAMSQSRLADLDWKLGKPVVLAFGCADDLAALASSPLRRTVAHRVRKARN